MGGIAMNVLEEVYTLTEAAAKLGLTEGSIRYYIRKGILINDIDYRKSGRVTLILKESLNKISPGN